MMLVSRVFRIELRPGEVIVAVVQFRDYLVAISDRGTVYKIYEDEP